MAAYSNCPDSNFAGFVTNTRQNMASGTLARPTTETLLNMARTKYNTLISQDKWTIEDTRERLLALESELKRLHHKGTGKNHQFESTKRRGSKEKEKKRRRNNDGDSSNRKKVARDQDEWTFLAPFPSEGKTKKVKNGKGIDKTFHWCSQSTGAPTGAGCDRWTIHTPQSCKGYAGILPSDKIKEAINKRNAAIQKLKAKKGGTVAVTATEITIDDNDQMDDVTTITDSNTVTAAEMTFQRSRFDSSDSDDSLLTEVGKMMENGEA